MNEKQQMAAILKSLADFEGARSDISPHERAKRVDVLLDIRQRYQDTDEILVEALIGLGRHLIQNSVDPDPEIEQILNDNFWDLV